MQDFTRGNIKVSSKNSIEYIVSSIESRKKERERKDRKKKTREKYKSQKKLVSRIAPRKREKEKIRSIIILYLF